MSVFYWVLAALSALSLLIDVAQPAWYKAQGKVEKSPTARVVGFLVAVLYVFAMTYAALNIGNRA